MTGASPRRITEVMNQLLIKNKHEDIFSLVHEARLLEVIEDVKIGARSVHRRGENALGDLINSECVFIVNDCYYTGLINFCAVGRSFNVD